MTLPHWLLLIAALLGASVPLGLLARRLRLPPTVVLALAGVAGGYLGAPHGLESPLRAAAFEEVVAFLFLPVLVFEAALGLSVRAFLRNLPAILLLAIPALLLGAGLVGYSLYWVLGLPLLSALVFGVLISATDPVAVVAVFRKLGVPERLLTLVEGESLLNDGVAIVVYQVLLVSALGGTVTLLGAAGEFVRVFFGGLALGAALGLLAVLLLPWLQALSGAAFSLALAYGGFVGAEQLGLSGVTATLAAGLVLTVFLPSRASAELREGLHWLWGNLGFIANSLLFLLIGLALDARLLLEHWAAGLLALAVVLVARALAVLLLVGPVERVAGLPRLGRRNQAVLIWGGLRGGVALALALALPAELAQRELLIALTGGVVLGTLVLTATTVGRLVHRLGLDRPTREQRFLALIARLSGIRAARERLEELGLDRSEVETELAAIQQRARGELERLRLSPGEELRVVMRRALFLERETYQRLADADLLPPPVARTLLHEVDDHLEHACLSSGTALPPRRRHRPAVDRAVEAALAHMPPPPGVSPSELAYTEASARRLAARRTGEALGLLSEFPQVDPACVERVHQVVESWEQEAEQELRRFDSRALHDPQALYRRQAEGLSRMAAREELRRLSEAGLLPAHLAEQAAQAVIERKGIRG